MIQYEKQMHMVGLKYIVICVGVTSIWIVCLLMIMCVRIQMRENLLWLDEEWIAREMRFFTGFVGYRNMQIEIYDMQIKKITIDNLFN